MWSVIYIYLNIDCTGNIILEQIFKDTTTNEKGKYYIYNENVTFSSL